MRIFFVEFWSMFTLGTSLTMKQLPTTWGKKRLDSFFRMILVECTPKASSHSITLEWLRKPMAENVFCFQCGGNFSSESPLNHGRSLPPFPWKRIQFYPLNSENENVTEKLRFLGKLEESMWSLKNGFCQPGNSAKWICFLSKKGEGTKKLMIPFWSMANQTP